MLELKIDRLCLNVADAAGQEHRLRHIAERAVALLADRLGERATARQRIQGRQDLGRLQAPSVGLALGTTSDEQAADRLANVILEALALKLSV